MHMVHEHGQLMSPGNPRNLPRGGKIIPKKQVLHSSRRKIFSRGMKGTLWYRNWTVLSITGQGVDRERKEIEVIMKDEKKIRLYEEILISY